MSSWPWTRIAFATCVCGPALAIGGVPSWVVPAFTVAVAVLWWRLLRPARDSLRIPWVVALAGVAVVVTALQWLPIPGIRAVLAPRFEAEVAFALAGTGVSSPPGLAVSRADTGLELARLLALTVLVAAAAQLSWRVTVVLVAALGTGEALIGLAHEVLGTGAIFGVYVAHDVARERLPALLGTFVNPNHQSGLLLLGAFAALAMAVDERSRADDPRDRGRALVHRDRSLAAGAAAALQIVALVLSLSRGAMLVALALGPVAFVLAQRGHRVQIDAGRSGGPSSVRLLLAAVFVLVIVVVARHGAVRELGTLTDFTEELEIKLASAPAVPALVALSPVLGIGRGSFIDVYGRYETVPVPGVLSHIECTPLAMVVEWGVVTGLVLLVGLAWWWWTAMRHAPEAGTATPRRIALLGLLALALQSLGDFSLEFLGVAAPAAALVGALSPARTLVLPHPRIVGGLALALATVLALATHGSTWTRRAALDEALAAGELAPSAALHARPLDGRVHALLGRMQAEAGDWDAAQTRAVVATTLRPRLIDPWLLLAATEQHAGRLAERDLALRRALALAPRIDEALARYLVTLVPEPARWARLAPEDEAAWMRLSTRFEALAPAHADAMAAARAETHPHDPMPELVRFRIARKAGHAALALHHARLARHRGPAQAETQLAVVDALASFRPPRTAEMIAALEAGLAQELEDSRAYGMLEERLVRLLVTRGEPGDRERAIEVGASLRGRDATLEVRRRRARLLHELERPR